MTDRIVHSTEPFNAEPSLARLRAEFITPQAVLYVRSHGKVPVLEADAYRLRVGGRVGRALDLSLADLRAGFAERTVEAVLQCAGNRRAELAAVKPVSGDPWQPGAIGNAAWTGVALADVLQAATAPRDETLHAAFTAADELHENGKAFRYAVSIPLAKARAPEVLLAWAMNGEALTPEHGAPLRLIVPGYAGVRSAKWLTAIDIQDTPSDSPVQASDYKLYPAEIDAAHADPAHALTIDAMPLNAVICEPADGATLLPGPVTLRGYAVATGAGISRVEISADVGRSWRQARLEPSPSAWSWVFWEADLDLVSGDHVLVVRAWDRSGQTQPASAAAVWNHKGYLCTAWHRVTVSVQTRT